MQNITDKRLICVAQCGPVNMVASGNKTCSKLILKGDGQGMCHGSRGPPHPTHDMTRVPEYSNNALQLSQMTPKLISDRQQCQTNINSSFEILLKMLLDLPQSSPNSPTSSHGSKTNVNCFSEKFQSFDPRPRSLWISMLCVPAATWQMSCP